MKHGRGGPDDYGKNEAQAGADPVEDTAEERLAERIGEGKDV